MRGFLGNAVAAVALAAAFGAAGAVGPAGGGRYVGTEYDTGGAVHQVNGPVASVSELANKITDSTNRTVREIAAQRRLLPYGRIKPGRPLAPQLTTYPAPAGIAPSDQYSVTLRRGRQAASSFVYRVGALKTDTNQEKDTSWTSFSFSGAVRVAVHKLAGQATGCLVRPESAHIRTRFASETCYFTLTRAANLSVEFAPDTTNPVLHPMLVFANPPESDVPPVNGKDVLYLGPGIHKLGQGVELHSNETVYLAGGAWVEAAFIGNDIHNVVIRGRGVIDGEFLDTGNQADNKNQPGLIDITGSRNVVISGITLVDSPRFNVRALGEYDTIHNVKIMSWWYSTDGIVGGSKSLIEDNFIKVNDDSIKLYWGDTIARYNVIWQLENGAPFMMSWNVEQNSSDFHVYDDDVIHVEQNGLSPQAVFRARHAGAGHLQDYLFNNINVEDANWRLFYIILEDNKWYNPALGYGQISNVIFRDIYATTPFREPSVVAGINPAHQVDNVAFENVFMDGTCVSDAAQGNFQIDPATTNEIRIMRSAGGGCRKSGARWGEGA